jgi:hypothetical protein
VIPLRPDRGVPTKFSSVHSPRLVLSALVGSVLLASAGCGVPAPAARTTQPDRPTAAAGPASSGFSWFKAGPAPTRWLAVELPDRTAVLAYPPTAAPVQSDPGTVAAETAGPDGQPVLYLNATPQQGSETTANWRSFRLAHLRSEHALSATLDSSAAGLAFRGGTGSCVADEYVTRIGAHHYREIACLVTGVRGGTVIVAATPAERWSAERGILEQAVDSYEAL